MGNNDLPPFPSHSFSCFHEKGHNSLKGASIDHCNTMIQSIDGWIASSQHTWVEGECFSKFLVNISRIFEQMEYSLFRLENALL